MAIYGTERPDRCETHKEPDDKNFVESPCISCGLEYLLDETSRCENCIPKKIIRVQLAKQNALMAYLDMHGLPGDSTDIIIDKGICGRERPDRVYDFADKIVILECDEKQHSDRNCECEQTRMVNIGQSFGGLPVYFIRWNPDKYKSKVNEKINIRYKLVGDLITSIKEDKYKLPLALVSAIYLYYNGWTTLADEEWNILTPME